jgi:hypothetical protein
VLTAWQVFRELICHELLLLENHKYQTPYEYQKHVFRPSMLLNKGSDKIISLYLVCTIGCVTFAGFRTGEETKMATIFLCPKGAA